MGLFTNNLCSFYNLLSQYQIRLFKSNALEKIEPLLLYKKHFDRRTTEMKISVLSFDALIVHGKIGSILFTTKQSHFAVRQNANGFLVIPFSPPFSPLVSQSSQIHVRIPTLPIGLWTNYRPQKLGTRAKVKTNMTARTKRKLRFCLALDLCGLFTRPLVNPVTGE